MKTTLVLLLLAAGPFAYGGETPLPGAPGWFVAGGGRSHQDYEGGVDASVFHNGKASAWLRPKVPTPDPGGCLMQVISAKKFVGKRWMRVRPKDGDESLAIDNMAGRPLKGTNAWTKVEIVLDVPPNASNIMFGSWVGLKGKIWLDDVALEVVDLSVPTTDQPQLPLTPRNPGFEERP